MKALKCLAMVLVVVGALNWGLWGFFQFDLVAWIFHGNTNWMSRLVYAVIGLCGVWSISMLSKCRKCTCGCHSDMSKGGKGSGCCK